MIPAILFEPYIIFLITSLIISIIYFHITKKNNSDNEENEQPTQKNKYINSIILFLVSYLLSLSIYYGYKYFSTTTGNKISDSTITSGGNVKQKISHELKEKVKDKLTIFDDDISVGILENN